jgi:uncharacterized protein YciI
MRVIPLVYSMVLLALIAWAAVPAAAGDGDLPLPDAWSTHYAWFLLANPAYCPGSKEAEAAITAAHIQYQLRLQAEGCAIAAGGLGPGPDGSIVGLTLLRASSLEEARAMAEADPAVRAGRLRAHVRAWWVPAERLP